MLAATVTSSLDRCSVDSAQRTDDDWPLSDDILKRLDRNGPQLFSCLEPDDYFIGTLFSKHCITEQQHQRIRKVEDSLKKNEHLLDILRRRSIRHFHEFISVLRVEQRHLAALFEFDGGK